MAITKLDAVLEAIEQGKTNDEIRDEIDGRLSDKRLDKLRQHPNVGADDVKRDVEIEREVEKIFAPTVKEEKPVVGTGDGVCWKEINDEELVVEPLIADAEEKRLTTVTAINVVGIMEYFITEEDVVISSEGVTVAADQLDELIAELEEVKARHAMLKRGI